MQVFFQAVDETAAAVAQLMGGRAQQIGQRMGGGVADQVGEPGFPVDLAVGQNLLQPVDQTAVPLDRDAVAEQYLIARLGQTQQVERRAVDAGIGLACAFGQQIDAVIVRQQKQVPFRTGAFDSDFTTGQFAQACQSHRVPCQHPVETLFGQGEQGRVDHAAGHGVPRVKPGSCRLSD